MKSNNTKSRCVRRQLFNGRAARLSGDQRGAALVDFALVLPFLLVLSVGLVDIGRMMWYRTTLEHVAREGTRWAAVRGAGTPFETTKAAVADYVRGRTIGISDSDLTVNVDWTSNVSGQPVTVSVSMDFNFYIVGFLPSLGSTTLESAATMTFS